MKQLLSLLSLVSIVALAGCGQSEPQMGSLILNKEAVAHEKEVPDLSIAIFHEEELIDTLPVESITEGHLANWARNLARGEEGYDQAMEPAKWRNGELVGGKDRIVLDEEKLVQDILQLPVWERKASLPIEREVLAATADDVKVIQNKTIGRAKTSFSKDVGGRMENIRLSTESIDYVILGSGDTFTFNGVTGERSLESGYKEATVIMDGDFVDGIGGGVCQTSTTLYNAVLDAGLTVLERHPHSRPVGYVEEGSDAMVSWGTADLKFKNDFDYPIAIRGGVNQDKGEVWFEIQS